MFTFSSFSLVRPPLTRCLNALPPPRILLQDFGDSTVVDEALLASPPAAGAAAVECGDGDTGADARAAVPSLLSPAAAAAPSLLSPPLAGEFFWLPGADEGLRRLPLGLGSDRLSCKFR